MPDRIGRRRLSAAPPLAGEPSVSVRAHRSGAWTIVQVEGEMDVQAGPLVGDLLGRETGRVAFDLHGVTFLDAYGLGIMVDRQRRAGETDRRVRLVAPSVAVRRILDLTRTHHLFLTADTVDLAISQPLGADPEQGL
ncbi:STAS domain-containing protein [Nocardioides sp. W7]|uniref:STAS domain-containing protein n=1 Tax=Nocardioides sp. W7 TaxID=2931390 RepID=UPI001FD1E841|nr:STAS domain-containing protein [Nocardioides sp. W7]